MSGDCARRVGRGNLPGNPRTAEAAASPVAAAPVFLWSFKQVDAWGKSRPVAHTAAVDETRPSPPPPNQGAPSGRTVAIVGVAVLVAIAFAAVVATVAYRVLGPGRDHDGVRPADHVVTGPADGRAEATLDVLSGANSVTIHAGDLGDHLYRVETPASAGTVPSVVDSSDRVQLYLRSAGGGGPAALDVRLNPRVRWHLRLTAGATSDSIDGTGLNLAEVTFVGGVTSVDLTLPKPAGTVPVQLGGGASRFSVRVPQGVPVRVRAGGGAGTLSLDTQTRSGVTAGTVLASDGWDAAKDRYDIDATTGVATLTVARN
jgi:hypothetical protein